MQMDFVLKNTHTKGEAVRPILEEKTGKLEKYMTKPLHAKWMIAYENEQHIAHLHVFGDGGDYFGESKQHNLFSAIEEAVDKVERQLVKHKEILKSHHR
jgi:putative sigma-54 modulation protein